MKNTVLRAERAEIENVHFFARELAKNSCFGRGAREKMKIALLRAERARKNGFLLRGRFSLGSFLAFRRFNDFLLFLLNSTFSSLISDIFDHIISMFNVMM